MEPKPDLDDAMDVALDRTLDAQLELTEALGPDALPAPDLAERVVHRADDLHTLADEAAASAADGPDKRP